MAGRIRISLGGWLFFPHFLWCSVKQTEERGLLIVWMGFGKFNQLTRWNVLEKFNQLTRWNALEKFNQQTRWNVLGKFNKLTRWNVLGKFNQLTRWNVLVWEDEFSLLVTKYETQLSESASSYSVPVWSVLKLVSPVKHPLKIWWKFLKILVPSFCSAVCTDNIFTCPLLGMQ
jgi:hypothetical protein